MNRILIFLETTLRRVFNKKRWYYHQGGIYLNDNYEPVVDEITDRILWKEELKIKAFSYEESCDRAFELFHFKYPELRGKIWLF